MAVPTSPKNGTPVKIKVKKKMVTGVVTGHTDCFVKVTPDDGGKAVLRARKNIEVIKNNDGDSYSPPRTFHAPTSSASPSPPPSTTFAARTTSVPEKTTSFAFHENLPTRSSAPKPSRRPYHTRSQEDPRKSDFPFKQGFHEIGYIRMLTPGERNPIHQTLAGYLFGDRILKLEYQNHASNFISEEFQVMKTYHSCGYCFELLVQKLHSDRAKHGRLQRPELYYVITHGPGLEPIDLQDTLKSLFGIESLTPYKAASRMELLLTPAKMTTKTTKCDAKPMIFDHLSSDQFEMIEENCHEGCGFISRTMAVDLLGSGIDGRRATTIQCRAIVPGIGLLKGLFKIKEKGIDKIQVPSSMIKIGPSQSSMTTNPSNAILLVKRSFPSEHNRYVAKFLKGEKVCRTGMNALQEPLSDMIRDVLLDSGVPMDLLAEYDKKRVVRRKEREAARVKKGKSRREKYKQSTKQTDDWHGDDLHVGDTYCVGVVDPTSHNFIPNGHVFIPGLPDHVDSVLVTRSPSMDKTDLLRLPLLKNKPLAMSEAEWKTLNDQHFGDICFGNGSVPLPNLCGDGDNDGDLYFVLWETNLVECVPMASVQNLERDARLAKRHAAAAAANDVPSSSSSLPAEHDGRFGKMQHAISDVRFSIKVRQLIGCLYNEAKFVWQSGDDRVYEDYVSLGNAYKKSLDLRKHGDKVRLPRHLWDAVHDDLREFLVE